MVEEQRCYQQHELTLNFMSMILRDRMGESLKETFCKLYQEDEASLALLETALLFGYSAGEAGDASGRKQAFG